MPAGSSSDNPASNPGPRTARKAAIAPRPEARDCKNFREMPRRRWATGCVRLCFPKALITVHVLLKNSIPTGCHELYTAITNAEQLHAGTLPCPILCYHNGAASLRCPDDAAPKLAMRRSFVLSAGTRNTAQRLPALSPAALVFVIKKSIRRGSGGCCVSGREYNCRKGCERESKRHRGGTPGQLRTRSSSRDCQGVNAPEKPVMEVAFRKSRLSDSVACHPTLEPCG